MAEEQKTMNRWWVVVGALIIQVSLGAVYIWSVFQSPLKEKFPWSESAVTRPAQLVLACFALAVIFGGRFQDKFGPRKVATVGGIILGLGLILARFTEHFSSSPGMALTWLLLTFSVLGGLGIGAAYVCPIATCVKWFPDKRGLITGLAVAGFGAGAFFFAPLATGLITGKPYTLLGRALSGPMPVVGVFNTFMILGIIFLVAVVLGAQVLRNPPPGYKPSGWNPPQPVQGAAVAKIDYSPMEMLGTRSFWVLWLTYFAGCTAGLMIIMKASPIWQSFTIPGMTAPVPEDAYKGVMTAATMAVSILAIFNAIGRIAWGKVSDMLGRKMTLIVMFAICGVVMLVLNQMRGYSLYLLGVCTVGLCFGGYLALYPAVTADFFGTKHYGINYGWMFSAYGIGGIVGPELAAKLMKALPPVPYQATVSGAVVEKTFKGGDYSGAFLVAGIACIVAAVVVTAMMKKPAAKSAQAA